MKKLISEYLRERKENPVLALAEAAVIVTVCAMGVHYWNWWRAIQ